MIYQKFQNICMTEKTYCQTIMYGNLIPVSLVYFNDLYNMYYDLALSFHMILLHLLIV